MRTMPLVIAAVLLSAAPAFAQSRDTGDVSVKATEPPIDQSQVQRSAGTIKTGISTGAPDGTPAGKGTATGGPTGSKANQ